jgi:type VI secretion system secreted protein VgrG
MRRGQDRRQGRAAFVRRSNTKFQMFSDGKLISEGVTNEVGETGLTQGHVPKDVVVQFLENH